ncbi:MAG: hypothetical protein HY774_19510 [Acidobacteria bacterium]|nr:hypothetical protein [Acidobacteriota bacterium]
MTDDTLKLWQVIVYGIEYTIDEETLKAWILAGKIRHEDRVKKAGTNWTEARNVPKLRELLAQAASLQVSNSPSQEKTETPDNSTTIRPGTFPKQPPHQFTPSPGAWKKGDLLVVEDECKLPHRCLKCNSDKDVVRLNYQFSYRPRWPLIFIPVIGALLVMLIVVLLSQHRQMEIWLCRSHYETRYMASILGWVVFVPGFIILVNTMRTNARIEFLICMMTLGAFGIVLAFFGQIAQVLEIRDSVMYLKKVHPDYVKQFPDWPHFI